jgi:anti-sigma regulatory factor (Ser/Thr protein kinase)
VQAQRDQEFAGDPRSPSAARAFAKDALAELLGPATSDVLRDDVELVVSELVTNAVRAGSARVLVSIEGVPTDTGSGEDGRGTVVIRVSDDAEGWPEQREAGIHDPGGRGLPLVSALSQAWGVRLTGTGKVVWAELTMPAS